MSVRNIMLTTSERFFAVFALIAFVAIAGLGLWLTQDRFSGTLDADTAVDLHNIATIRSLGEQAIQITDKDGRHARVELDAACPGIESSKTLSLVTLDLKNIDQFSGLVVNGHVCSFRRAPPQQA
jgi:hypothetical protein